MVKIKIVNDKEYYIEGVNIEELPEDLISTLLDKMLTPDVINGYMLELKHYRFGLTLINSYQCDQCFEYNEFYEGEWQGVALEYANTCFDESFIWDCSDEELIKKIKNTFSPIELFKIGVYFLDYDYSTIEDVRVLGGENFDKQYRGWSNGIYIFDSSILCIAFIFQSLSDG